MSIPSLPVTRGPLAAREARRATPAEVLERPSERFRRLVDEHFDFIWRSLRGLGVPASGVDDAAQHVFWLAHQKLASIAPGAEKSFLFGLARGVAANQRRAAARARELGDGDFLESVVSDAPDPEELSSLKQARVLLDRALDALPFELRTVFVLFELEGLTTQEIAELTAVPTGTVASRLRKARSEFHVIARRLEARGRSRGGPR